MSSRFVQQLYRGLVSPLVTPKSRFSSGSVPSTTSGSSKKGNSNNEMTMTILKVVGGFLPGVYIGHVLTDKGVMEPPEESMDGDDKDDKDKDDKDKDAKGKDKKADGKDEGAKDKGKDVVDNAKDKLGDAKDSVAA